MRYGRLILVIGLAALTASSAWAGFSGSDVFLPSVGRGPGSAGSQWYTTLWVYNPGTTTADIQIFFYLRNQANPTPAGSYNDTVAPGETVRYENAVSTLFGTDGFGAVRVVSSESVVVNSRIFSIPSGSTEAQSVGQFFGAVPASFAIGLNESTDLLGVFQTSPQASSVYRYNFGFVEVSGASATVRMLVYNAAGLLIAQKDYTVGAWEPMQVNVTDLMPGVDAENLRLNAEVVGGAGRVIVFGSGLANQSSDPSTFEMSFSDDLLAGSSTTTGIDGVTAGAGLSGGGTSGNVILNVGAGTGIDVAADTVGIATGGVGATQLATGAVTKGKLSALGGTSGQVLSTDGSNLMWSTPSAGGGLTLPFDGSANTGQAAFQVTNTGAGWAGLFKIESGSNNYPALVGSSTGSGIGVYGNGHTGAVGVKGVSSTNIAVIGQSNSDFGVYGQSASPAGWSAPTSGVWGDTSSEIGVYGTSAQQVGTYGETAASSGGHSYGVGGSNRSSGNFGLLGSTSTGVSGYGYSAGSYGVYGAMSGSNSTGYAGYFNGRVYISGSLNVGGTKNFLIDDPLDPANRYLVHAAVESSEALNQYSGTVVLGEGGEATVELPAWVEAVNRDFRYQLTCIGGYAPVYIAEEISRNRFRIAGGVAGLKVSWQVTGVRDDAEMQRYPFVAERPKPDGERGRYLCPECFGQADSAAIDPMRSGRVEMTPLGAEQQ